MVRERHRHRYEVNNRYVEQLVESGLVIAGKSEDGELVEMVELADHPWFIACQFVHLVTERWTLFSGFVQADWPMQGNPAAAADA